MLVALMLVAVAAHIGNVTHAEVDPAKEQRERGLRLFVEIRKELTATGQTNVVAKLDQMVNNMLLEQVTHELGKEVGILTRLREAKYTNVIHSLEIEFDSTLVSFTGFEESGLLGPAQIKALQAAKKYRTKYGLKSASPEIDEAVIRLLDVVKEK